MYLFFNIVNWNPSLDLQAQDRSYRFGQKNIVSVYRLVSQGTVEELIYMRQLYKQALQQSAVQSRPDIALDPPVGDALLPSSSDASYKASRKSIGEGKRAFRGIQGDREHTGELFGLENLLQFENESILALMRKKYGFDNGHASDSGSSNEGGISTELNTLTSVNALNAIAADVRMNTKAVVETSATYEIPRDHIQMTSNVDNNNNLCENVKQNKRDQIIKKDRNNSSKAPKRKLGNIETANSDDDFLLPVDNNNNNNSVVAKNINSSTSLDPQRLKPHQAIAANQGRVGASAPPIAAPLVHTSLSSTVSPPNKKKGLVLYAPKYSDKK